MKITFQISNSKSQKLKLNLVKLQFPEHVGYPLKKRPITFSSRYITKEVLNSQSESFWQIHINFRERFFCPWIPKFSNLRQRHNIDSHDQTAPLNIALINSDILLPSIIIIMQDYSQALNILWRCGWHTASPIDYLLFSLQYMGLYMFVGYLVEVSSTCCSSDRLPFIFFTIYGVYVFNWPISVLGDWKDISIAHVIVIIESEVSTFPIVIIFSRGCVPEMFITSYSVSDYIYVPAKPGICFHYYCAVYDECKYSDTFWLADRTRLFVQYTISLSSLCKLIWRHWTYKMPVRYILSSMWVRLRIFPPLSIMQYVGLYVFRLPIPLVMIERIYILCLIIIINSEIWIITHCLRLGHETMVFAVRLSIFFWKSSLQTNLL